MAPGFRSSLKWEIPLTRQLGYGFTGDLTFSVVVSAGEVLCPKSVPRQCVKAAWWRWLPSFRVQWKQREHINVLELRAILLAVQHQISHLGVSHLRLFHVTDSFVAMSVVAKGRAGSRHLGVVLKFLNAHLLGFGLTLALGHVKSTENPPDGAPHAVALLH